MGNQVSSQGNYEDAFGIMGADQINQHNQQNMNSQPSRSRDNKQANKRINIKDSDGSGLIKENSSYKGVKTEISCLSVDSDKDTTMENTDTSLNLQEKNEKENKISTKFEWRDGGNTVFLTGSFCNWGQQLLMNLNNNKFETFLDLPKGIYEYKFIVDGKWRFSKHFPTCNDGKGNINNIIDTTNYVTPKPINDLSKNSKGNGVDSNIKLTQEKNDSDYNCVMPLKKDMHLDATTCPDNYREIFSFTKFPRFMNRDNRNILNQHVASNENTSFQPISIPSHVNLNHLTLKVNNEAMSNGVLATCSTHRVRNKFVTLIYFKPVNL
jgi:hypothetical protein